MKKKKPDEDLSTIVHNNTEIKMSHMVLRNTESDPDAV